MCMFHSGMCASRVGFMSFVSFLGFCFGGRVEIEETREFLGVDGHLYTGACAFGTSRLCKTHCAPSQDFLH